MKAPTDPKLIPLCEAARQYGMSAKTMRRLEKSDPDFPRPVRLSARMVLLRRNELEGYFTSKQQASADRTHSC